MITKEIFFHAPGAKCEGILHLSEINERARCVIAHPHPQYGGDMDNNVVHALCDALPKAGITCLRFNFRGVGRSTGSYEKGEGEAKDFKAAFDFLSKDFKGPIFGAAYSFGAYAAGLAASQSLPLSGLALISPALILYPLEMPEPSVPLMVICGDNDVFCPVTKAEKKGAGRVTPQIINGADHFWTGYEQEMVSAVKSFFANILD